MSSDREYQETKNSKANLFANNTKLANSLLVNSLFLYTCLTKMHKHAKIGVKMVVEMLLGRFPVFVLS